MCGKDGVECLAGRLKTGALFRSILAVGGNRGGLNHLFWFLVCSSFVIFSFFDGLIIKNCFSVRSYFTLFLLFYGPICKYFPFSLLSSKVSYGLIFCFYETVCSILLQPRNFDRLNSKSASLVRMSAHTCPNSCGLDAPISRKKRDA